MNKLFVVLTGLTVLFAPVVATAATLKMDEVYTLGRGETLSDDLYAFGERVSVAGNVIGDVVVAGGNLFISGQVSQDLRAAGGTITMNGSIGDDAHIAGGDISIEGGISDDLMVAGGQVHLSADSHVQGDVFIVGGQIRLDGRVNGDVKVTGGQIKLSDSAVITGKLIYRSGQEAQIASGAQIRGGVEFNRVMRGSDEAFGAFLGLWTFGKFLMMLVLALLFVWILKKTGPRLVHHVIDNFPKDLLRGFLVLILVPIAIVLVAITVVGIPISILALLGYIAWLIISSVTSAVTLGSWLMKAISKSSVAPVNWKSAVLGAVVYILLAMIPFVGWLAVFLVFLASLGAVAKAWYDSIWLNR